MYRPCYKIYEIKKKNLCFYCQKGHIGYFWQTLMDHKH